MGERKVIPVSPNSLYSYLMAIVLGLKGFKIEQQAKLIMTELSKVQSGFADFFNDFNGSCGYKTEGDYTP